LRLQDSPQLVNIAVDQTPSGARGLYFALAVVGIFSLLVGAAVRLRRPDHQATLHFFWLSIAFFGMLAFSYSGRLDFFDWVFYWGDITSRLMLPPLFVHFALVFPERPDSWVRSDAGRRLLPLLYLPAALMGGMEVAVVLRGASQGAVLSHVAELVERGEFVYLAVSLVGGLAIMIRALKRGRSVTARRQLRWIVWGTALGAIPFVLGYVVPFTLGFTPSSPFEFTAVLLGLVPLAFASAIIRYRLMDVEVIIKRARVCRGDCGHCGDLRDSTQGRGPVLPAWPGSAESHHRAARHDRRRSALEPPEERDSDRARSRVLPRSVRLSPCPRRIRPRSQQRSRSSATQ
jgi:hypothetical protein